MTDHEIKKPTLFISHATSDAEFANAVQQEIEKVFANGINVFCTSSPGAIPVGKDWLSVIEKTLEVAQAIIAIVTPVSIERPWLWFEIGATWSKGRSGECKIYPLCAPEIGLSNLPPPLDRLQALSMGKAADLKLLFEALMSQFGFGKLSSFRATNISKRIPRYKDVKVVEMDLNEKVFYSGKYTGYGDDELMEVIDTGFFQPDDEKYTKYLSSVCQKTPLSELSCHDPPHFPRQLQPNFVQEDASDRSGWGDWWWTGADLRDAAIGRRSRLLGSGFKG